MLVASPEFVQFLLGVSRERDPLWAGRLRSRLWRPLLQPLLSRKPTALRQRPGMGHQDDALPATETGACGPGER